MNEIVVPPLKLEQQPGKAGHHSRHKSKALEIQDKLFIDLPARSPQKTNKDEIGDDGSIGFESSNNEDSPKSNRLETMHQSMVQEEAAG